MSEIDTSEIEVKKTVQGLRVSLPLHGRLIRYTANRFNDNPDK